MCSKPILHVSTSNDSFRIEVDSSNYTNGGVLSQLIDGKWHPIVYHSESLESAERNYMIYNKELLAITWALEDWHHYLQGAKHKFEIWTDHCNLSYFNKPQNLNPQQAHWHTYLQLFNYSLCVKPGNQMGKANILSRPLGLETGENDNKNIQIFPNNVWIRSQPADDRQT